MAENKARHAFGSLATLDSAIESGKVDAYDILFLKDGDVARIGWLDKNGNKVIVESKQRVVSVDALPTDGAESDIIYLFEDNSYIWNGTDFVCLSSSEELAEIEEEIANKVDEDTVDAKISEAISSLSSIEVVEF